MEYYYVHMKSNIGSAKNLRAPFASPNIKFIEQPFL